jgi:hypothetical protein
MLAIKFYHLRTLIHRPYLCLPLLTGPEDSSMTSLPPEQLDEVRRNEKLCIAAARETAHLLHSVIDEKDLVHDFPWWQMISCLICASSILLVASLFTALNRMESHVDAAELDEDAETCLKVFEALGANSDGARIARDMMQRLREHCIRPGTHRCGLDFSSLIRQQGVHKKPLFGPFQDSITSIRFRTRWRWR